MINNKVKPKKICISGGGNEKDSFLLDKDYINSLGDNKKILYIPVAMEIDEMGFEACYDWIIDALSEKTDDYVEIDMCLDLSNQKGEELDKYQSIYIGGGNTFKLLDRLNKSNFMSKINNFLMKGGIVYGGSAGAIILGSDINTVKEENNNNYKYDKGLSLLGEFSVLCHYNESYTSKVNDYIDKFKKPVIALPEKCGLKIVGNTAKVLGYENATLFDINKKRSIVGLNEEFVYDPCYSRSKRLLSCK